MTAQTMIRKAIRNLASLFLLASTTISPAFVHAARNSDKRLKHVVYYTSGKVVSQEDGTRMAGVNVLIKGSQTRTATDVSENNSIHANNGDI